MNILQDLVLLHSKNKDENFPVRFEYDPDYRPSTYLELILIGFGALMLLAVTTILSIPDKERQEELKNIDVGREFAAEPCDMKLKRIDVQPTSPVVSVHRSCVY